MNNNFFSENEEEHDRTKPAMKLWEDLVGNYEVLHEEFALVITRGDTPEADDELNPETFDNYVNMKISLDKQSDGPEFATVTKRMKDK